MVRQIQVAMNSEDERAFLAFLNATANIQVIKSFAPRSADLFVEEFSQSLSGHWSYSIWNKQFDWLPEFGTVGDRSHDPSHIGWKYVSNKSAAPILEFSRSDLASERTGRLYWAKDFAAPNGLNYDAKAFSAWIDQVWSWVRKHGLKNNALSLSPYLRPSAQKEWLATNASHTAVAVLKRDV